MNPDKKETNARTPHFERQNLEKLYILSSKSSIFCASTGPLQEKKPNLINQTQSETISYFV